MAHQYEIRATEAEAAHLLLQSRRNALIFFWSIATGVGVGLGWFLVHVTGLMFVFGSPLGICQGLVLAHNWKRALLWAPVTAVVAGAICTLFGPYSLLTIGWSSAELGGSILLYTFLGVPVLSWLQCASLNEWIDRDDLVRWFGASVFSFPIVALFGKVVSDLWVPAGYIRGMVTVQAFEPRMWVIGAMWGACTGWALAKMPQIVERRRSPHNS